MKERLRISSPTEAFALAGFAAVAAGVVVLCPNSETTQLPAREPLGTLSDEYATVYSTQLKNTRTLVLETPSVPSTEATTPTAQPSTEIVETESIYDPVCRQLSETFTEAEQRDLILNGMNLSIKDPLELKDGTDSLAMFMAIDVEQDTDFEDARRSRTVFGVIADAAGYTETPSFDYIDPVVEGLEPGTVVVVASAGDC